MALGVSQPCRRSLRAEAPAPHHHNVGRAGQLGPVPGRARECPLRSGAEDRGPDLVLGHTHQTCDDGHLLLRISGKVLGGGNGLLDRGRLIAHPRRTGELRRLGFGAHGDHDQTIPDHIVFAQCSKSRAGLRRGRTPACSGSGVDAEMRPGELEDYGPLFEVLSKVLAHLEHGHAVLAKHGTQFLVRHDLALVLRILAAWCTDRLAGAEGLSGVGERPRSCPWMPIVPFKLNQDRRHHIPRQRRTVTNWPAYDASLRQRGSLTVWFTEEAVEAWAAEPRTTRGGQPWYSELAILPALTLRAVFRLAFRQTEGLIGSIIGLLGLTLRVPDHTTLSRRAATVDVPQPRRPSAEAGGDTAPVHLLVDSTGLKLCGPGEWLIEKHGTRKRRSWRKLHLGRDADTGQIVAATLTTHDVDDGSQVGPLLDQVDGPIASFTGDGAYDQDGVYASVAESHPAAAVIVPPRSTAVPSATAETAPTQRDRHLQLIAERGRRGWQMASGYTNRARAEATIGRYKRVIGDGLRSHTDERRATEMDVAVQVLNRMLELGRPTYVRIA